MTDLLDDVLEAWDIHNDINLYILDWVPDDDAASGESPIRACRGGRHGGGPRVTVSTTDSEFPAV